MEFVIKETASNLSFPGPAEIVDSFGNLPDADQESFWVLGLDAQNREILRKCLFLGGLRSCTVDPKIVFKRLLVSNCSAFVVVHNHPSGNTAPSAEDKTFTKMLKDGGEILDIKLLDSIIIGDGGQFSQVVI